MSIRSDHHFEDELWKYVLECGYIATWTFVTLNPESTKHDSSNVCRNLFFVFESYFFVVELEPKVSYV